MIRTLTAIIAAVMLSAPAFAADVTVDLTASDPSDPGGGWSVFNAAHGTRGKPFEFRFVSGDTTAFPLSASGTCGSGGACIRVTAGTGPDFSTPKECSLLPAGQLEPDLEPSTEGNCFYRLSDVGGSADVYIYHLGLLEASADIRVEISNLTPALPFHTFIDFDTTATPNGAPQPIAARPSANFALVIDKSGSMGWSNNPLEAGCEVAAPPPPDSVCEPTRWEVLNRAAQQMVTVAKAYVIPGDEVGAVAFDTTAHPIQPMIGANSDTLQDIADGIDNMFNPGGGTSIGDGVDHFDDLLASNVGDNNLLVVFSDGIQNAPSFLRLVGGELRLHQTKNQNLGSEEMSDPENVDICVFALRAEGTADPLDLQGVADARCGGLMFDVANVAPENPDLIAFFLQVLNRALIGDKLELVDIAKHQAVRSQPEVAHTFTIEKHSIGFTVLHGWQRLGNGIKSMTLEKDGLTFKAFDNSTVHRSDRAEDHLAMTLREACGTDANGDIKCLDSLAGKWTMRSELLFEVSDIMNTHSTVISDNSLIATEFSVKEAAPGLEKPLVLRADLKGGQMPITGLPPGSVTAIIRSPQDSRGHVLANLDIRPGNIEHSSDPITAAAAKAIAALGTAGAGDQLRNALSKDGGTSVDLLEISPGIYEAEFNGAKFEGAYGITFYVDAVATTNIGPFQRIFKTSHVKSVLMNEARTLSTIKILPAKTCRTGMLCATVQFTPQDVNGILVGPAFSPAISVSGGAEQVGAVADLLDGSYRVVVACPKGIACKPKISVGGSAISTEIEDLSVLTSTASWDAKMICGRVKKPDGPVTPGLYRTVINILATGERGRVGLRFAPAIPSGQPVRLGTVTLRRNHAVAINCKRILRALRNRAKTEFVDGMLTISSEKPLSVSAVYSTSNLDGKAPSDVEVSPVRPRQH